MPDDNANRAFKTSSFAQIFNDVERVKELYCAIEGVILPPDVPVKINTLSDAFFMKQINDLSFEIGDKLVVLVEYQSTVNPNMPLRMLMYAGRLYEKIVAEREADKALYRENLIRIPKPEFIVLYSGVKPAQDIEYLPLTTAFKNPAEIGLPVKFDSPLELVVKVVNINEGRNEDILKRCRRLNQYSVFLARTRKYIKETGGLEAGLRKAIKECLAEGILTDFLSENSTEVFNMLFTEFDMTTAKETWYEDGVITGRKEGKEEGKEEVARNALARNLPLDVISELTGFDSQKIQRLAGRL